MAFTRCSALEAADHGVRDHGVRGRVASLLLDVRTFNATGHALLRAVMQPMLRLFKFRQCQRVFTAGKLAGLESA